MIEYHTQPPIPTRKIEHSFTQTLEMRDGTRTLGRAVWNVADGSEGVIQILELWIDPAVRRAGHGRQLLHATVEQARLMHKVRKQNLRRLWAGVGHKSQVVGRSFLTAVGFHLIGSTAGLLKDQELLVYVKSLD